MKTKMVNGDLVDGAVADETMGDGHHQGAITKAALQCNAATVNNTGIMRGNV